MEFSLTQLYRDLDIYGFHVFDWGENTSLEPLAQKLGSPVPSAPDRSLVDTLVPKDRDVSRPGTLSSIHGTEAFPFHTETAHWKTPVDWIILKCVNPGAGNRPTILIDSWNLGLGECEIKRLTHSLMVVKSGSRSFLAPLVTYENGKLAIRHDLGCMKPATEGDASVLRNFEQALEHTEQTDIKWKVGQALILDNRRILHSRAKSSLSDSDRRLERIYVLQVRR